MTEVRVSTLDDYPEWIRLAREVEPLFGPMADVREFQEGLKQALQGGTAFCVKGDGEGQGGSFRGGIVVSFESNEILWLAVSRECRGQGVGETLVEEALRRLDRSRPVTVTTFDGSVPEGIPARRLYLKAGFADAGSGGMNPAGYPTMVMTRTGEGA
jgi:ribosomal protein S18 acetylase RimI-like enzyme